MKINACWCMLLIKMCSNYLYYLGIVLTFSVNLFGLYLNGEQLIGACSLIPWSSY